MKTEVLFGIHPVFEALKAGRRNFTELYLAKEKVTKRLESTAALAKSMNIPVKIIPGAQLNSIAETDLHQGIGAKVSPYPFTDLSQILDASGTNPSGRFLLAADSIVDTHNLGALIRTALCAGIDGIIIPKDRAAPPTPAVSKASAGALEHVLLTQVTNLTATLKQLKEYGLWIAGMDASAPQTIYKTDLTGNLIIIIGGEEKGIRPLVKAQCDFLISIPQHGRLNSLNASAAGAVVLYEAYRQRELLIDKIIKKMF